MSIRIDKRTQRLSCGESDGVRSVMLQDVTTGESDYPGEYVYWTDGRRSLEDFYPKSGPCRHTLRTLAE